MPFAVTVLCARILIDGNGDDAPSVVKGSKWKRNGLGHT